ncbi:FAD-dependent oxidoreductase [Bradyrhizobium japonicum]|uniref:FAD-dependent oxidoreductase n=1 Tax=Bradyrhizobium japonicum TaxID=375 RepID=UPI001BACA4B0|nr:FAD-dependent oxidoreductase [Bradyrhizobium japonicum]MBR0749141.1 FAD-dependent oxidoreductase [Bradyrhizobium japonicum]
MSASSKPTPAEVESSYRVSPALYVIGSLERGVTIYSQQVRAHNLVWALAELHRGGVRKLGRVAIVGGGIAGLTTAACLLSLLAEDKEVSIDLFEQSWDLCPLQQGADVRWVHPHIYNWPRVGSRAPGASLPVLDWAEGRASDVARTVMREFGKFHAAFAKRHNSISIYLGLRHFRIDDKKQEISWIAHRTSRADEFFHLAQPEGTSAKFDTIILATGFGTETPVSGFALESYWRNEQLGQPPLDGVQRRFLVSGFGDGALVDLCRLTVERFRQDTILYELFETDLEAVEAYYAAAIDQIGSTANVFELFKQSEEAMLLRAKERLRNRLRKDTQVTLHLRGRKNEATTFPYIFGPYNSFLHRLLIYLLYRCGALALEFGDLESAVIRRRVDVHSVLCRYGAKTIEHLASLFVNAETVTHRFEEMKEKQLQLPERLWLPGAFPHYSQAQV